MRWSNAIGWVGGAGGCAACKRGAAIARKNTAPVSVTAGRNTSGIRAASDRLGNGDEVGRNRSGSGGGDDGGGGRRRGRAPSTTASMTSADWRMKRRKPGE